MSERDWRTMPQQSDAPTSELLGRGCGGVARTVRIAAALVHMRAAVVRCDYRPVGPSGDRIVGDRVYGLDLLGRIQSRGPGTMGASDERRDAVFALHTPGDGSVAGNVNASRARVGGVAARLPHAPGHPRRGDGVRTLSGCGGATDPLLLQPRLSPDPRHGRDSTLRR